ncbi:MAG TPA: hypothetical protein VFD29_12445 [Gillisia sp.]|nr:hypothetical protein [Gillisia sp.]
MKVRLGFHIIICFSLSFVLLGCARSNEAKYKLFEKNELAKGIRHDSLFKGLYLKMPLKEFRTYSFDMNIKGQFKQGGQKSPNWVQTELHEMSYPATLTFYPQFKNDSINEMNAAIYYENAKFKDGIFERDSLLLDVLNLMDKWYGGETFKIKSPNFYKEDVYVKVNGNRRITLYPDANGQLINMWYVDLTNLKEESK